MPAQHQPNAAMKETMSAASTAPELKPCPFCASPAVIDSEFVGCPECEIGFSCKDNNPDDVGVLAWNHRPCSEESLI
ncbi:MAG: hypothetical protein ACTFAK_11060 [Candidatus Electronema sp. VV]